MFKWSPSDKYFARVTPGQQISVYETPSMILVDKKSIKIEGVEDFEWAPAFEKEKHNSGDKKNKEKLLSYWTPEIDNQPARVTLLNIPSKEIIRTRNLVNVKDVSFFKLIKIIEKHTKKIILYNSVKCTGSQMVIFCVLKLIDTQKPKNPHLQILKYLEFVRKTFPLKSLKSRIELLLLHGNLKVNVLQ